LFSLQNLLQCSQFSMRELKGWGSQDIPRDQLPSSHQQLNWFPRWFTSLNLLFFCLNENGKKVHKPFTKSIKPFILWTLKSHSNSIDIQVLSFDSCMQRKAFLKGFFEF